MSGAWISSPDSWFIPQLEMYKFYMVTFQTCNKKTKTKKTEPVAFKGIGVFALTFKISQQIIVF